MVFQPQKALKGENYKIDGKWELILQSMGVMCLAGRVSAGGASRQHRENHKKLNKK